MPVISTRRYSTSSGSSSYLPPSIGGTTSSLSNLGKSGTSSYNSSNYRSSSLTNSTYSSGYSGSSGTSYLPRTSSFRTGLYGTSSSSTLGGVTSYRHSSYLTGGNNDTTSASRFGVSSNKYTRSSSDRDTKRITGKTQYNNNIINTTTTSPTVSNRTKLLQSKPPISGSLRTSQRLSENQIRDRDHVTSKSDQNCNSNYNSNNNNSNCNELISNNSKFESSTAGQLSSSTTTGQDQLSNNNNNNTTTTTKKLSSSSLSSSSSLARQVATSGLDFYEKYSPVHYIPKCELSRSRSLSEATTNKYNNDNKLSNSSSNVHQLLHQKEVNKLQDSKDCKAAATTTTTSATSSSPSSSSKDISTTQLASKVKKLFAATASNTATNNNNFVQNLNASSIVVFNNNNNNHHNQYKKNIQADANNVIPNKNPLQTVNSTAHRLSDKLDFSTTLSSSETFNKVCSNDPSASSFENCNVLNCQNFSIIDTTHFSIIRSTTNDNSVVNKKTIPCTHCCSNSNHQEQMIHTCRNCNKTTATVFAPTTSSSSSSPSSLILSSSPPTPPPPSTLLSQSPTQLLQSKFQTGEDKQNSSATIISINSSANLGDQCISNQNFEAIKSKFEVNNKPNLKATKQLLLLNSKSDDNKNMSNNSYTRLWAGTNNSSSLATASACVTNCPSSVTVTYHTTTTTVTIQSPNTVTTVNANIKPSKIFNKNNLFDFRLEFSKHKQGSTAGRNNSPITTISSSSAHNTEVSTKDGGNNGSPYFGQNLISTYRDQNFLKNECEIARSQVVKLYNATNDINSSGLVESEEYNNNNINNSSELLNNKYNTSSKNDIKPLVHKTSKNKTTSRLAKIISNSNMNCLQNTNSEFLDDIKYIDSDDSERQHNNQNKSSLSNNSSSSVPNYDKMKFNHSKLVTSSTSTLPLTSKQRDLINSDSSSKTSATNKFNTLNDFKRIPTSVRSTSNYLTSNKLSTSLSPSTSNNISNRSSSLLSVKNKTKIASSTPVINNISTSSTSRESTPSNSPQMIRRNNLLNSDNFTQQSKHHYQQQHHEQHIPDNSQSLSSSSPTSSPSSISNDQKLSNKKCDIDESVRNASIRSALPSSPTPSRYWDREGRTSGLSSRYNDLDDYSSTKSALNSSESNEKVSTEGLCGLRNIGNTCFMNSVIQCLSHTRELTKFLKTQTSVRSSTKDQQILYEFAKLIREMWTPNIRSVTPLELKSAFSSKHRMYSGYNQQDAQEFLRFFLDSLHCALNNGVKGEHLKIDDSLSDNRKADLTWEWYAKIENSVVRDLFVGQLKSTLKCTTCGNTSVTFDPFWDLSVPLPSNSRCKLDSCLDLFIREEVLDGDEMPTCSKCQIRRKCTKSFTIQRFPKYLVIHLKRFSETRWSKMSNIVEFPTGERELNMGPYAANGSSVSYSLYAISNHMGSTAGGHYVALCKHPTTKKWHEFNDNVVSDALSESVLVSSSAYLLFYERA